MSSFKESEFVSLCQDIMTATVSEQAFFRKVTKTLFITADPITKNILTENVNKLYTFLITMSSHPMRVPLSHAMTSTFLSTVIVNSTDISKLLAKHNTEYSLKPDISSVNRKARSFGCPYDTYFEHILGNNRRTKGVGRVKVVLIFHESDASSPCAVEFKLNVPFKTVRKTMYVDITAQYRPKGEKILTFIKVNNHYEFDELNNDDFFYKNTPIGKALSEYYKMWGEKEEFLRSTYRKFTKNVKWMYFTSFQ